MPSDHAPNIGMIIALVEQLPQELLPDDSEAHMLLIASVGAMRAALEHWWGAGHPGRISTLRPMAALNGDSPVTALLKALRSCPDEAPAEHVAGLEFIANDAARRSLRIDASAAHRAAGNGEYKAATVLAGSVIESLLLWAIADSLKDTVQQAVDAVAKDRQTEGRKRPDRRGAEYWHLPDYIEVAAQLQLIDRPTRKALELTAEYRNLIHPGRVLRSGLDCSQSTALTALGAMERLMEHLYESAT